MRTFFFIAGLVMVVTLAILMSYRMSADALAVVIGIICGILASIPTSAMLVWVMRQRDKQETGLAQLRPMGSQYPPVVVVNGPGPNGYGSSAYGPPALAASPSILGPRQFKVIGQENTETVGDVLPTFWEEV
jgi:hypothetical protein